MHLNALCAACKAQNWGHRRQNPPPRHPLAPGAGLALTLTQLCTHPCLPASSSHCHPTPLSTHPPTTITPSPTPMSTHTLPAPTPTHVHTHSTYLATPPPNTQLNNGTWSEEEDRLLAHWNGIVGNRWSEVGATLATLDHLAQPPLATLGHPPLATWATTPGHPEPSILATWATTPGHLGSQRRSPTFLPCLLLEPLRSGALRLPASPAQSCCCGPRTLSPARGGAACSTCPPARLPPCLPASPPPPPPPPPHWWSASALPPTVDLPELPSS